MKSKSILSIYAIFFCLFVIFMFNVNAATNHSHFACGKVCNHDTTHEQTSMSVFTSYSTAGKCYLNSDITMNKDLVINSNMTLCLNGNTLTFAEGYGILVEAGNTFVLCDCIGDGEILQATDTDSSGISMMSNQGEMFIYGGNIATSGERNLTCVDNNGTLEIHGGNFGTDVINYGTMKIYGGDIVGDSDHQNSSLYNGLSGTTYIYDGTIENEYPLNNCGTMKIYGGKILGTCNCTLSRCAINNLGGKLYLDGAYVESSSSIAIKNTSSGYTSISNSVVKADVSSKGIAIDNSGGELTVGTSIITGKNIGIRSSSNLVGQTNQIGAKCEIKSGTIINGGTYGIYNSSNKSVWNNSGYTTTYISHSKLTVNNGAIVNSIYVNLPEALYYENSNDSVTDIYIDEESFGVGDILAYGTNVRGLNLQSQDYYLYSQYGDIYIDSRIISANGDDVRWNLSSDGVLTIFGNGKMKEFNMPTYQPWYGTRLGIDVKEVIIKDGITHIGSSAFERLNITKATISNSVKTIGYYAFMNCDSLEKIVIPSGTTQIQRSAFNHCEALNEITIPVTVTNIGDNAFYNCIALTDVNYEGSKSEWKLISIGTSNDGLNNANIHFGRISSINVTVSNNDKTFIISPIYAGNGNLVILALYDGNKFVKAYIQDYQGDDVKFTITEDYTSAKVMLWESLDTLFPSCEEWKK